MSTLFWAILILVVIIIVPWFFIVRYKKTLKKQTHKNFRRFSTAGTERDLSFSRQEVIQNMIVGLDGIRQVVMIAELDNNYDIACIPINELARCGVEKVYDTVGEMTSDKERILKEIRLVFYFQDNRLPIYILFYSHQKDNIYLMADMEAKAVEWKIVISKLILNLRSLNYKQEN